MKTSKILVATTVLFVAAITFLVAVLGDFFLMKAMEGNSDAPGREAREIMAQRYQSEDVQMIAQARTDGYEQRILMPLVVEKFPELRALGDRHKTAPLGLQANSRVFLCNEGYGAQRITTDRFGFRNEDEVWDDAITELAIFGDSFIYGLCLPEAQTIAGQLALRFNLRNMSFPGAFAVHYDAMMRTFIPALSPERAVLVFYANDNLPGDKAVEYQEWFLGPNATLRAFFRTGATPQPADVHTEFYATAKQMIAAQAATAAERPNGFVARNLARVRKVLGHATFPATRQVLGSLAPAPKGLPAPVQSAIDSLGELCAMPACSPLVVYIPNSPFWDPDPRAPQFAAELNAYANTAGLPFLDVSKNLEALGREGYAKAGIHLSPEGAKLVSDHILEHYK